ncbi:MAG TPA: alpha/beta hydrolase [Sandaracinaceae bacterium LLY-WYZ-13_1]|nr:alpha/beta hydrolase [Sandaracinaceae bacterium LLY-WYZ-13_1]
MADDLPSHTLLSADDRSPQSLVVFLHGILGQGLNWRSFARRLVAERPAQGALLVDLRAHGDSRHLPPPDTLEAAADDLTRLRATLEAPVTGIVGHSFGGKVALQWLARDPGDLTRCFVIDSLPGARPDRRGSEGTVEVVEMLASLPDRFESRDAFRDHVTGAGFSTPLAHWLAQSLDRLDDDGHRFGLDVARIRALLEDYFATDLWPVIDPPPEGLEAHLVIGGRSTVFSSEDRERATALAARHPGVFCDVLDTDHWVHVEDPDGLFRLVAGGLS